MLVRIGSWCAVLLLGAAMLTCTFGGRQIAAAQDSTSSPAGVIPDAALCQADPRTVDELVALFDGATSDEWEMGPDVSVPTGRPGSAALIDDVSATLTEAVACLNAGDFLRFFGLLTDHAIVTAFWWLGAELATNGPPPEIANPTPLAAEMQQSIVAVADVRSLGVDRAGAFLVIIDPASGNPGSNVLHLTLLHDGTGWLIDEVIEFSGE